MRFVDGLALLVTLMTVGCVPEEAPVASRGAAILGGTVDTADPAVVVISTKLVSQDFANCTASVISPHLLLTAAHCVDERITGAQLSTAVFLGDSRLSTKQTNNLALWRNVVEVHLHPDFAPANPEPDLAVLVLDQAVEIAPVPLASMQVPDELISLILKHPVRLVGYGLTAPKNADSWGVRYQTTSTFTSYSHLTLSFGDGVHSGCEGDSGGPALVDIGDGERLWGVMSRGVAPDCLVGGTLARVDVQLASFLDPLLAKYDPAPVEADDLGADLGGRPHHSGCSAAGERSAEAVLGSLLVVGVLALLARRQRSV